MGGAVKIQGREQVLGQLVYGSNGRRLGHVAAVQCAPDPYTVAWLVIQMSGALPARVAGRRRRLRAVPGATARWGEDSGVSVPYQRDQVLNSPPLAPNDFSASGLAAQALDDYYRTAQPPSARE